MKTRSLGMGNLKWSSSWLVQWCGRWVLHWLSLVTVAAVVVMLGPWLGSWVRKICPKSHTQKISPDTPPWAICPARVALCLFLCSPMCEKVCARFSCPKKKYTPPQFLSGHLLSGFLTLRLANNSCSVVLFVVATASSSSDFSISALVSYSPLEPLGPLHSRRPV